MKNMTLGKQIGLGFATLVAIMLVLGSIAIYNMNSASANANTMAKVYVPEVKVGADVFKVANNARYAIRAFTMVDDEEALASAKKDFQELQNLLAKAKELAQQYKLTKLSEYEQRASNALVDYMASVSRSEEILKYKKISNAELNKIAPLLMDSIHNYALNVKQSQVNELNADTIYKDRIVERIDKILDADKMVMSVANIRVWGQMGQAQNDIEIIKKALAQFEGLYKTLDDLFAMTRAQRVKDVIDVTKEHLTNYEKHLRIIMKSMEDTLKENTLRIKLAADVVGAAEDTILTTNLLLMMTKKRKILRYFIRYKQRMKL